VYPRIGAAGRSGGGAVPEQALEHPLELELHRSSGRLALPPNKPGAVEVQRGEEGPAHRPGI